MLGTWSGALPRQDKDGREHEYQEPGQMPRGDLLLKELLSDKFICLMRDSAETVSGGHWVGNRIVFIKTATQVPQVPEHTCFLTFVCTSAHVCGCDGNVGPMTTLHDILNHCPP